MRHPYLPAVLLCSFSAVAASAQTARLSNGIVTATFGSRGVTSIALNGASRGHDFRQDEFGVTIDGTVYDSARLAAPSRQYSKTAVTYTWRTDRYRVNLVYELQPAWTFLSKRIVVTARAPATFHVDAVDVFRSVLTSAPVDVYVRALERQNLGLGEYGGWMRFDGGRGLLAVAQNPFLRFTHDGPAFTVRYAPEMDWNAAWGPFESDRGLLVPYRFAGRRLPARMIPEWRIATDEPEHAGDGLDVGEIDAFRSAVRAFLVHPPERPTNIFVGWCVNDYQIDIATQEGRTEYKGVIDRAAELGAKHVLFAPTNSALARRDDSTDDWSWENLLWLGLGQKIRRGEWDPRTGQVPASVAEMIAYAKRRDISLLAYVYPVLAFSHDPGWLVTRPNAPPDAKKYASLGFRSLQDWLIETLVAFHDRTGIGGYSFDHTFLTFTGASRYAQWYGWRRVMETLRRRIPGIVIDGRQAYHLYGPWSWLAGTYPHPTYNDEQPESFVPFPDLSFDRVSADRERYTAYRYRNYDFAPGEIVPGFITHQTSRSDDGGDMPQHTTPDRGIVLDRFRARNWDYLGWRYSLLSSIAVAGWNNVINMIPARDVEEYRHFRDADKHWFRRWIDWTDEHRDLLRHTRSIVGQPALGKIDGTAAIDRDHGYVFLFNPNARRLTATLPLDDTIGLEAEGRYVLKEVYPLEGRNIGKPGAGAWTRGDRATIEMDGHSALVLLVSPLEQTRKPIVFNTPGTVSLANGTLTVGGVRGETGTSQELVSLLPPAAPVARLVVNGSEIPFARVAPDVIAAKLTFAGAPFRRAQQIGEYDPSFTGGSFKARFRIPQRVFAQLAARQKAWPIPWTPEDYRTTWLAPERLLLYVQIAEPDERWDARLTIDGRNVELKKAYSAVRAVAGTFVGFYADVSLLSPDRDYEIEVGLPPLKPGQFQGVFVENVETEYTDVIDRP